LYNIYKNTDSAKAEFVSIRTHNMVWQEVDKIIIYLLSDCLND